MHFLRFLILFFLLLTVLPSKAKEPTNYTFEDFESRVLTHNSGDTLLVINFWATWCGPCIRELPYFEEVNSEKGDQAIRIILVSLDFKDQYQKKLLPFIEKKELKSEIVWLDTNMNTERINKVHPDWSGAIPATLFMKNGKILNFKEKELSLEELKSTINNLL